MRLPFDILDYIFGLLRVSDQKTLIACLKVPELSPIVERHIYYHIIVEIGFSTIWTTDPNKLPPTFGPVLLSKFVFENPHIVNHVRILQIQINSKGGQSDFANTLLMFPVLKCIMLAAPDVDGWRFPGHFRAALEDCLSLPTLEEVHFRGEGIPISLLNSKNIKILSLSSCFMDGPLCSSTLPQPHSLWFLNQYSVSCLIPWIKLHTKELRSFKSKLTSWKWLSEVLGVCSGTLNKLDIEIGSVINSNNFWQALEEFHPVLPNLEQLTIRTRRGNLVADTWLPAVVKVANLLHSSLRQLSIDIKLEHSRFADFNLIDFSPLGSVSRSIPRTDLYFHSDFKSVLSQVTHGQVLSSLEVHEDIARSIKEGVFVIHSKETAPDFV